METLTFNKEEDYGDREIAVLQHSETGWKHDDMLQFFDNYSLKY